MCLYMVNKDYIKKTEKGDIVTRLWYTLKNLDPPINKETPITKHYHCFFGVVLWKWIQPNLKPNIAFEKTFGNFR